MANPSYVTLSDGRVVRAPDLSPNDGYSPFLDSLTVGLSKVKDAVISGVDSYAYIRKAQIDIKNQKKILSDRDREQLDYIEGEGGKFFDSPSFPILTILGVGLFAVGVVYLVK
jgi:hypothetical protein